MTVGSLSPGTRSARSRATWSWATWSQATCTDSGPGRPNAEQAAAGAKLTTTPSLGLAYGPWLLGAPRPSLLGACVSPPRGGFRTGCGLGTRVTK